MIAIQPSRATGFSLISTMIGLVIGSLTVIAMISLYLAQAAQSTQTRNTAAVDGQSALGIVVAQLEMQRAGFGVVGDPNSCLGPGVVGPGGTANADFVLLRDVEFGADGRFSGGTQVNIPEPVAANPDDEVDAAVMGNAVVWRWVNRDHNDEDDDGDSLCGGMVTHDEGVVLLSDIGCTSATDWNSLAWDPEQFNEVISFPIPGFSVYRTAASCTPFGRLPQSSGLKVAIEVGQSVAGMTSSSTVCIPNLCQ